jgi:hypothetical protein
MIAYRDPTVLAADHPLGGQEETLEKLRGLLRSLAAELTG